MKQLLKGESQPQHVPGGCCSNCPSEDQCNQGGFPPIIYQIKRPKKSTLMFSYLRTQIGQCHTQQLTLCQRKYLVFSYIDSGSNIKSLTTACLFVDC